MKAAEIKPDPALPVCPTCSRGFNSEDELQRHEVYCSWPELTQEDPPCSFRQQLDPQSAIEEFLDLTDRAPDRTVEQNRAGKKTYFCTLCDKAYGKSSHLKRHFVDKHERAEGFVCSVCQKVYRTENSIKEHMRRSHNAPFVRVGSAASTQAGEITCALCSVLFASEEERDAHQCSGAKDAPFACKQCALPFASEQELQMHEFSHIAELQFDSRTDGKIASLTCSICSEVFACESDLQVHKCNGNPMDDGSHVCLTCRLSLPSAISLKRHQVSHMSPDRPSVCDICRKTFRCDRDLRKHKRRVHFDKRPDQFTFTQCLTCYRRFKSEEALQKHECEERGRRLYPCPICEVPFDTAQATLQHVALHANLRPFICLYCRVSFKRKDTVKNHVEVVHKTETRLSVGCMRMVDPCDDGTSNAETQYECLDCLVKFTSENALRTHECSRKSVRIKSSKKDALRETVMWCRYCSKSFQTSEELMSHQDDHISERPYLCTHCQKTFKRKDTAKDHVAVVHRSEPIRPDSVIKRTPKTPEGMKPLPFLPSPAVSPGTESVNKQKSTPKEKLECEKCETTFKTAEKKKAHVKLAHDEEDDAPSNGHAASESDESEANGDFEATKQVKCFPCPICLKIFFSLDTVMRHMVVHASENTKSSAPVELLSCKVCGVYCSDLQSHECSGQSGKPSSRLFPCPLCEKVFPKAHHVRKHLISHSESRPFRCTRCSHGFKSSTHLYKHIRRIHKVEPLKADSSETHSDSEEEPTKRDPEVRRECPICFLPFTAEEPLAEHLSVLHGYKSAACSETLTTACSEESCIETEWLLVEGEVLLPLVPVSRFLCPSCFRVFKDFASVQRHVGECTAQLNCTKCHKSFRSAEALDTHVKRHFGDFSCMYCGVQFVEKRFIRRHVHRRHKGQLLAASPEEERRALYKDLERESRGEQPESSKASANEESDCHCLVCFRPLVSEYCFTGPDNLTLLCPRCDYSFTNQFCLDLHLETHGELPVSQQKQAAQEEVCFSPAQPVDDDALSEWFECSSQQTSAAFVCSYCPRQYKTKASLKRHLRLSHAEKGACGFPCSVCSWVFASEELLATHEVLHDGEIGCIFCKKTFGEKKYLRMHYLRRHPAEVEKINSSGQLAFPFVGKSEYDNSFPCGSCHRAYKSRYSLVRHLGVCETARSLYSAEFAS